MNRFTIALLMLVSLLAAPAHAHSMLSSIVPADGATVAAPKQITFTFSQAVHLVTVKLTTESAEDIVVPVSHTGAPTTTFTVSLPALTPGAYSVAWTASGADGHVMKGTSTFTVSGGKATP